jgi:hypothetical protein
MLLHETLLLMAAYFIVGGLVNVFLTSWALGLSRAFIPGFIARELEAIGFLQPRTVRIAGWLALALGASLASCVILRIV